MSTTTLMRLKIGDRFRCGSFCGRLVALTTSAATIEIKTERREFVAHDDEHNPKVVVIKGGRKRITIAPTAEVEKLS